MAVRQYVGARYVPKFSDPVEWQNGTSYEALTIVTYNNSSYTSKVPVPAAVGDPADNPEYWALTGNYNAQVEQYRQETVSLTVDIKNLEKLKLDWINAIEYGFSTENFNDNIMSKFIENDSENVLYFPHGTYTFKNGFNFPDNCHIVLHPEACLKLNGTEVQDCFISVRHNSTRNDYSTSSFVIGGTIDANYKANRIFGCSKVRCTILTNVRLINSLKYGIDTMYNNITDGVSNYDGIVIENTKGIDETEVTNTVGIFDRGFDTKFYNAEVVNFQTSAQTISGTFSNYHPWIRSKNIIPGSIGVRLQGYNINLSNIVIDTFQIAFEVESAHNRGANISNLNVIRGNQYTQELLNDNPQTIFKFNTDFAATMNLKVTNAIIPDKCTFRTLNFTPLSSFLNIRSESGNTTNIQYYISSDRTFTTKRYELTTDEFGQVGIENTNDLYSLVILSPNETTYVPISNGIKIFRVSNDNSHDLTPLTNTTVTIQCVYAYVYLNI